MQDVPGTKTDERTGAPGPSPQSAATSTSEGGKGTSGVTTYTKDQVEKLVSDRLAAAGRDAKSLEEGRKAVETGRARFEADQAAWQKQREAAEETALRDDPDAFQALQRKREVERKEADLKSRKEALDARDQELAEREKVIQGTAKERMASQIAAELGVEANPLLKFTDGSEGAMRELASALPKKGTNGSSFKPDSGKTAGGAKDLNGLSPHELARMHYEK